MSNSFLKDYLTFTRKERIGIMVLIMLIIIIFIFPSILQPHRSPPTAEEIATFHSLADSISKEDDDSITYYHQSSMPTTTATSEEKKNHAATFYFDPNLISIEQWLELGLKQRTAITIHRYLSKGGRFKTAGDLKKIYGLTQQDFLRLRPYVKIESGTTSNVDTISGFRDTIVHKKNSSGYPTAIDVNTADSNILISLPGIGPKIANRIVHFRERLGGFYSIEQVKETYGLPDSTFEKIRSLLFLGNKPLVQININLADAAQLKNHPYFTWAMANAVVQYRKEHGAFNKVEDLAAVSAILPDQLRKLIPYLSTY